MGRMSGPGQRKRRPPPPSRRTTAVENRSPADEATPVQPGESNVMISVAGLPSSGGLGVAGVSEAGRVNDTNGGPLA